MISDRYTISVSQADALIFATLNGRWTSEIVDIYKVDLLAAGKELMTSGVCARKIGILIDTRTFLPQALHIVSYYSEVFAEPRLQNDRIAVLYKSTLQKMQTRRMAVGTPHFFEQKEDAINWLLTHR